MLINSARPSWCSCRYGCSNVVVHKYDGLVMYYLDTYYNLWRTGASCGIKYIKSGYVGFGRFGTPIWFSAEKPQKQQHLQ